MADLKDTDNRSLTDMLAALRREALAPSDPGRVIQDLQIHQIELEMQNRELRAAQQALEESRDRYADLYDFAPAAYATINRLGQITQMNLTAAQLLGVERGLALNLLLTTRLLPGDGRALLASLARVLTEGEAESIEVTLGRRPPRPRRDLRLLIRREGPQRTGEAPTACRVILLDITEIKEAQAAILNQQRFLQSVVDGIADPIRVTDLEHQVLLANAAAHAVRVDGSARPPLPGGARPDADNEDPGAASPVREVLASNAVVKVIERRQGADDRTRWIERIGAPLRSPAGEMLGVIESSRDITEHVELAERLQERERQLEQLVKHDALTGLPNRVFFADRLGQAIRQAQREQRQLAVLFVDLDGFKAINDSRGHPVGDQVLTQAAARMRARVRESDTVARLGGDEFAIVLATVAQHADAGLVAHKLVDAFRQPFVVDARSLAVTLSIGISLYPADGADAGDPGAQCRHGHVPGQRPGPRHLSLLWCGV